MDHKSDKPTLKQSKKPKKLGCSSITLQRYRQDLNMFSPYRNPPDSKKRKQKISTCQHDLEETSIDLKRIVTNDLNG